MQIKKAHLFCTSSVHGSFFFPFHSFQKKKKKTFGEISKTRTVASYLAWNCQFVRTTTFSCLMLCGIILKVRNKSNPTKKISPIGWRLDWQDVAILWTFIHVSCMLCAVTHEKWAWLHSHLFSHDSMPLIEFKCRAWPQDQRHSLVSQHAPGSFVFLPMPFILHDCANQHIAECSLQGGIALQIGLTDSLRDAQPTFLSVNQCLLSFLLPCIPLSVLFLWDWWFHLF